MLHRIDDVCTRVSFLIVGRAAPWKVQSNPEEPPVRRRSELRGMGWLFPPDGTRRYAPIHEHAASHVAPLICLLTTELNGARCRRFKEAILWSNLHNCNHGTERNK
jgi:hypothetical protein